MLQKYLHQESKFKISQVSTGGGIILGGIALGTGIGIAGYFMSEWIEGKEKGVKDFFKDAWSKSTGKTYDKETEEYQDYSVQPRDFTGSKNPDDETFNENFGEPIQDATPIVNPLGGVPILGGLFGLGMWIGSNTRPNPFRDTSHLN